MNHSRTNLPIFKCVAAVRECDPSSPQYPPALAQAPVQPPIGNLWIIGDVTRLSGPAITIVGSRRTPPSLLTAAASLARVLSDVVGPVVSGGAAGADSAALAGAVRGRSGAIVIPACGLGRVPCSALGLAEKGSATLIGLFPFYAPFNAGYAIQRNSVLAAMGRALVLVASDLKGGSTYAVNWALAQGVPVFCFESGPTTPAANAHLIRTGRARALSLRGEPAQWADAIAARTSETPPSRRRFVREQLDWIPAGKL